MNDFPVRFVPPHWTEASEGQVSTDVRVGGTRIAAGNWFRQSEAVPLVAAE
jgi:hypothetical protein